MTTAAPSIADQAIEQTITRLLAKYPQHSARIERGAALLRAGAVRRLDGERFSVRASNGEREYIVTMPDDGTATCQCIDAARRGRGCKHAWASYMSQIAAIRFEVLSRRAGVPAPDQWSPEEAKRLLFARWLVQSGRVGEGKP